MIISIIISLLMIHTVSNSVDERIRISYAFYDYNKKEIGYKITIGTFKRRIYVSHTYYIYKDYFIKFTQFKELGSNKKQKNELKYTVNKRLFIFFKNLVITMLKDIVGLPIDININANLCLGNNKDKYFFNIYFDNIKKNFLIKHNGNTYKPNKCFEFMVEKFKNDDIKRLLNMVYNDTNLLGQMAYLYSKYNKEKFILKERHISCAEAEGRFGFACKQWENVKAIEGAQIIRQRRDKN